MRNPVLSRMKVLLVAMVLLVGVPGCDTAEETPPEDPGDVDDCGGPLPVGDTPPAPEADCDAVNPAITAMLEGPLQEGMDAAAAAREELLDPDTITVVTCGTGTPLPSNRAQSCTAVFAGGQFLLFDAGDGADRSMTEWNLPVDDLQALFLTHYHSDHVADVGAVVSNSWIRGRQGPLPVYGGEGLVRVVEGFHRIYALDDTYRRAHHGEGVFPLDTEGSEQHLIEDVPPTGLEVYSVDGVTVTAYPVDHSPVAPTLGYRVEYAGHTVAITSDTIVTEGLEHLCDGADIVVGDAMNKAFIEAMECALRQLGDDRNATFMKDIRTYHMDITELAELADDAGVDTLVLTHLMPSVDDEMQTNLLFVAPVTDVFDGEVVVASDGDRVTLPID